MACITFLKYRVLGEYVTLFMVITALRELKDFWVSHVPNTSVT